MIGESTDFTSQAIAFGYLGLAFGVGTVLGPLIGGTLTYPCQELGFALPLCGEGQLNQIRPFFLPCLGAALISAIATVSNIFVLRETLPAIVEARKARQDAAEGLKEAAVPLLGAAEPPDLEGAASPAQAAPASPHACLLGCSAEATKTPFAAKQARRSVLQEARCMSSSPGRPQQCTMLRQRRKLLLLPQIRCTCHGEVACARSPPSASPRTRCARRILFWLC